VTCCVVLSLQVACRELGPKERGGLVLGIDIQVRVARGCGGWWGWGKGTVVCATRAARCCGPETLVVKNGVVAASCYNAKFALQTTLF
jgi:hypothetical protein